MKEYNKHEFVCKLQKLNWNSVLNNTYVNKAWYSFSPMFKNVIEEIPPLKEVSLKQRNQIWFNGEVGKMICLWNQAYSKFKQSKSNDDYLEFKKIRTFTKRKIQLCKRDYILNQFDENKWCSKKLERNIKQLEIPRNSLTPTNNSQSSLGLKMGNSDNIAFDRKTITSKFSDFFCNIADKLVEKLNKKPFNAQKLTDFHKDKRVNPNAFSLTGVAVDKICEQLSFLNITKSVGYDGISACFLRDAAEVVSIPITHIINLSL